MTITTTVGDTYRFAIELLFDDFYDDDFVASGSFRMFVNGFPYGYQGACATTYYMIVVGLRKLSEENIIRRNIFNQYSDLDIATNYREARFEQSDDDTGKTYLGLDRRSYLEHCYDLRDYTENAFGEGSCMLMFWDEDSVKLIGFQITVGNHNLINVNSVAIPREEFDDIKKGVGNNPFGTRQGSQKEAMMPFLPFRGRASG